MNEFFKPTKWKIILMGILTMIYVITIINFGLIPIGVLDTIYPNTGIGIAERFLAYFYLDSGGCLQSIPGSCSPDRHLINPFSLFHILIVTLLYFISCLIVKITKNMASNQISN